MIGKTPAINASSPRIFRIADTFYYRCSALDGCSRAVIHWGIRQAMKDADVALVVESARERHPGVRPRIISDNGPQFNAKDFKSYIRLTGMTHVRTSPDYPQSNRKIERWHRTLPEPTEHRIRHEKRWLDPRIQRPYPSAQESGSR